MTPAPDACPRFSPDLAALLILTPKQVAYAAHRALYFAHQNPRKCETYNTTPCRGCGQPHVCPATN